MKDVIICISGKRQSGKTSLCNMLHAAVMANIENEDGTKLVDWAQIDEGNGELLVPAKTDNPEQQWGVLKLDDENPVVQQWLDVNVRPFIRKIALATPIKMMAIDFLGLEYEKMFGVGASKKEYTSFKWSQTLITRLKDRGVAKDNFMTYRDILEYLGEVFTSLNTECFVNYGIKVAESYGGGISVFEDIRKVSELDKLITKEAITIRLLRNPEDANTTVETNLDDIPHDKYSLVVQNQDMTIPECHKVVYDFLVEKGIFN